jgi:CspA family cold shock protein
MPTGRIKWFSLEKGFGFIASDEGEDVYLAATSLPEGVSTVKPGTKLEFGVAEGRRGPQALSVRIIDAPPSLSNAARTNQDDLAAIIEDTIKILDRVGNGVRQGRYPTTVEAERLGKVLRGIAAQSEAQ